MALFFTALVGFTFLAGAAVILLGAGLGYPGMLLGAALVVGTLLALLTCVLDRLSEIRQTLDELRQEIARLRETPPEQEKSDDPGA